MSLLKNIPSINIKLLPLALMIIVTAPVDAQQIKPDVWSNDESLRRLTRAKFNDLYILNSEISYITFGEQGHPEKRQYILNGNILPHYYCFPRHWRVNFILTPQVLVRIIANQPSLPVRTPSFIPGGNFYFPLSRDHDAIRYKYGNVGIFHHSNGQDGNPLNTDGSINLKTGNFSTNYLTLGFNKGHYEHYRNNYFKAELEVHSGLFKLGDVAEYRDRFGRVRLNVRFSRSINAYVFKSLIAPADTFYHRQFEQQSIGQPQTDKERKRLAKVSSKKVTSVEGEEKTRVVLDGMVVLHDIKGSWNNYFNVELKFFWKFPQSENTSFFASIGYRGHDKYNIYFVQPYPYVGVGIAAGNAFFYRKEKQS